jgi:hypothetical protein
MVHHSIIPYAGKTTPLEGRLDHQFLKVERDRTIDLDFDGLTILLELPIVDRAARKAVTDARVVTAATPSQATVHGWVRRAEAAITASQAAEMRHAMGVGPTVARSSIHRHGLPKTEGCGPIEREGSGFLPREEKRPIFTHPMYLPGYMMKRNIVVNDNYIGYDD